MNSKHKTILNSCVIALQKMTDDLAMLDDEWLCTDMECDNYRDYERIKDCLGDLNHAYEKILCAKTNLERKYP